MRFAKMHGLGNDFMVIDGVGQDLTLSPDIIRQWSQRHTGVGFDQCLVVESSNQPGIDFHYRIFNADGNEVYQCGNGARCLARFIHMTGLSSKNPIIVATKTTQMQLTINEDNQVAVQLPPPKWTPDEIPCLANTEQEYYAIDIDGHLVTFYAVSVGNPHAVLTVEDINKAPVATLGKQLSEHAFFPNQVNVGFLQISRPGQLLLRVYERGCGETQACGSGAMAADVVARRYLHQPKSMTVVLPGGQLTIDQEDPQAPITMTGPATFVYQGELLL
jgi:diaminopimelate epimerase